MTELETSSLTGDVMVEPTATKERVCARSGLRLVAAPASPVFRVGKTKGGAWLAPPRDSSINRASWGRWDTAGGRTSYAVGTREAAFAQELRHLRESLPAVTLTVTFPDDDPRGDELLATAVRKQMCAPQLRDRVVKGWREARNVYSLALPNQWLVDVSSPDTINALNDVVGDAWSRGVAAGDIAGDFTPFTAQDLANGRREVTTILAAHMRELTLEDGSRALGIRYQPDGLDCQGYAIWLRATDDGNPDAEPVEVHSAPIDAHDPDLNRAASALGMSVIK